MENVKTIRKVHYGNRRRTCKQTAVQPPVKQPVKIGHLLDGFDRLAEHPQRNEILKTIFRGFELDPYR